MLRMPTGGLRPGMRLGKSIYTPDGRTLLQRNSELRENYIGILQRLQIPGVYVVNDLAPDVEPADLISDQARVAMGAAVREALAEVARAHAQSARPGARPAAPVLNPHKIKSAVDMMVTDLVSNRSAVIQVQAMRPEEEALSGHLVSVCSFSVLLGLSQGLSIPQLHDLGLGAVLHDLGKAALPSELVPKMVAASPEELAAGKRHTSLAWEILSKQSDLSFTSAAVSIQHHERFGGGGYPRATRGSEIHLFARIAAIADFFDVLTADCSSRKGYRPDRALQKMSEYAGSYLDPELFRQFAEMAAPYPVGAMVQLSGGFTGVVVGVERAKVTRPRVRLLKDSSGRALAEPREIDLSATAQMEIRPMAPEAGFPFQAEFLL